MDYLKKKKKNTEKHYRLQSQQPGENGAMKIEIYLIRSPIEDGFRFEKYTEK